MFDRKLILMTCVAATLTGSVAAQSPSPAKTATPAAAVTQKVPEGGVPAWIKPETAEHRRERLGTAVDPGPDPSPSTHYWRFGRSSHIERAERQWAAYDREDGTVRPMANVNFAFEIYQQNDKYVWYWVVDPESQDVHDTQAAPEESTRYSQADLQFFNEIRPGFFPLEPAKSARTIRFEESSDGLPTAGSFRNSMAIADMNEDGFLDLVLPPQRGGAESTPAIYLGDGKGHWKGWAATVPHSLDYGSVVVADFNKDGHMDMAFSVHLTGVFVLLGDGKGHFSEVTTGLPRDFPTRRLVVSDVNQDHYPDLVAITEGPTARPGFGVQRGPLLAIINTGKGKAWRTEDIVPPTVKTGGDWLSVGDFNSDGKPDFVLGSVYLGSRDVVFLSGASAPGWTRLENKGDLIPWGAYFYANAAGKIASKKRDDAIVSYVRYWPGDLSTRTIATPPLTSVVGIDRLSFANDGTVSRNPIARWSGVQPVTGLALADVDGDGNLDIIYAQPTPRELVVLLGDGKGGFTRAATAGIPLLDLPMYDLKVVDVNGDRKPDVVVMYESGSATNAASNSPAATIRPTFGVRTGSVHVFLNRGLTTTAAVAPKSSK